MAPTSSQKRAQAALAALRHAKDPLAQLDQARQAREATEELEWEHVHAARAAGATWTAIGRLYGLTKQGAQQRFRDDPAKPDRDPKPSRDAEPSKPKTKAEHQTDTDEPGGAAD